MPLDGIVMQVQSCPEVGHINYGSLVKVLNISASPILTNEEDRHPAPGRLQINMHTSPMKVV